MYRHDTDFEFPFRQESNFWYLTGVNEPDFHILLDLQKEDYHLFAPQRDAQYAVWHGFIKSRETYQQEYDPDYLHYDEDLPEILEELDPDTIYCLDEAQVEFMEELYNKAEFDTEALTDAITYCRSLKTDWELDQLREAARINSLAHREVMKAVEPGKYAQNDIAKRLYREFRDRFADESFVRKVASPDRIQEFLPPGTSRIVE
jgi:Xaa-Pro dipeptidase